jgi:hypothetical protein
MQATAVWYNELMEEMTRDAVFKIQPHLLVLQKRLGELGGDPHIELTSDRRAGCLTVPDLEEQIAHGRLINLPAILRKGKPGECHGNSIALSDQDETHVVVSGFALADDRRWYHHSWSVQDEGGEKVIIETVGANDHSECVNDWKFEQYFGIEYKGQEAVQRLRHWLDQAWPQAPEIKPGSATDSIAKMLEQSDIDPERPE